MYGWGSRQKIMVSQFLVSDVVDFQRVPAVVKVWVSSFSYSPPYVDRL